MSKQDKAALIAALKDVNVSTAEYVKLTIETLTKEVIEL